MTANVEFEALTGFSNAFLPYGSIPYQQYVRGPWAVARELLPGRGLRDDGDPPLRGLVLEPRAGLQGLRFDRFLSIEKLPVMASRVPLVSDEALINEIIRRSDQTKRPSSPSR